MARKYLSANECAVLGNCARTMGGEIMKVCHICNMNGGKHLLGCWSAEHIKDIEQQLAAANARIAEIEKRKPPEAGFKLVDWAALEVKP